MIGTDCNHCIGTLVMIGTDCNCGIGTLNLVMIGTDCNHCIETDLNTIQHSLQMSE